LLLDPKATTLDLLRELILERAPPKEQHRVDWINNPLIDEWLHATAADTTHFCIDLEESDFLFEQVDEVCEYATKLQTIQQSISWTLTQDLFADAVLASATKSMGGRFTKMSASNEKAGEDKVKDPNIFSFKHKRAGYNAEIAVSLFESRILTSMVNDGGPAGKDTD